MPQPPTVAALYRERKAKQEAAKADTEHAKEVVEKKHDEAHLAFLSRKLTDGDIGEIDRHIRTAFDWREREALIYAFPSDYCPDNGRRINHNLPDWEAQLTGYAAEVYRYWEQVLKPGGFGFNARIITFNDGMPGDVGLFINWPEDISAEP